MVDDMTGDTEMWLQEVARALPHAHKAQQLAHALAEHVDDQHCISIANSYLGAISGLSQAEASYARRELLRARCLTATPPPAGHPRPDRNHYTLTMPDAKEMHHVNHPHAR